MSHDVVLNNVYFAGMDPMDKSSRLKILPMEITLSVLYWVLMPEPY